MEPDFAIDALMKQRQMALEQVRAAIPMLAGKSPDDANGRGHQPILERIDNIEHLKSLVEQLYQSFQSEIMMFRRAPVLVGTAKIPDRFQSGVRTVSDKRSWKRPARYRIA